MDEPAQARSASSPRRAARSAGVAHAAAFAAGAAGLLVAADAGPRSLALMILALLAVHWSEWFAARTSTGGAEIERVAAAVERIATALERAPVAPIESPQAPPGPTFDDARTALAGRDWARVESILAAHPDHPDRDRLRDELDSARRLEADELRERLNAAREANDPERVLELHAELDALSTPEAVKEINADLARWFMKLMMRRMRTGTVRADVADLAWRVSERFGSTLEGASLRASLPTLRRSAGLCPKCGKPYAGLGDACPACLVGSNLPAPVDDPLDRDPEERPNELGLD